MFDLVTIACSDSFESLSNKFSPHADRNIDVTFTLHHTRTYVQCVGMYYLGTYVHVRIRTVLTFSMHWSSFSLIFVS